MDKKSFVVRLDLIEQLELLNNEQRGAVFMAMCYYVRDGVDPDFDDPLQKMMWSIVKQQIDRDTQKYEEKCIKNAENGKKGGRPRKKETEKTERFFKKTEKTERFFEKPYSDSVCDSDSDSDSDSDCVCDCVCDCDARDAQKNTGHITPHTHMQTTEMNVDDVLALAKSFGYVWTIAEAQDFLAYNIDKGRTDGWDYAVKRWESQRISHKRKPSIYNPRKYSAMKERFITEEERKKMADYTSLANRFLEDYEVKQS